MTKAIQVRDGIYEQLTEIKKQKKDKAKGRVSYSDVIQILLDHMITTEGNGNKGTPAAMPDHNNRHINNSHPAGSSDIILSGTDAG